MNRASIFQRLRSPDEFIRHIPRVKENDILAAELRSSFIIKVQGDSMINAGIYDGDMLIVDSGTMPRNGNIVVVEFNDSLLVKKLYYENDTIFLISENPIYEPIQVKDTDCFFIKGVVRNVIREMN